MLVGIPEVIFCRGGLSDFLGFLPSKCFISVLEVGTGMIKVTYLVDLQGQTQTIVPVGVAAKENQYLLEIQYIYNDGSGGGLTRGRVNLPPSARPTFPFGTPGFPTAEFRILVLTTPLTSTITS